MNPEQRRLAQQILTQKDLPQTIEHHDDTNQNNPRQVIRPFLANLCETIGFPLPSNWPHVPPATYFQTRNHLQEAISRLYDYIEGQKQFNLTEQGALRIAGESTLSLLAIDWEADETTLLASTETQNRLATRPYPALQLDQLYCTTDSSERRCNEVKKELPINGRVLCLGDDDLCSLILSSHPCEVHVVDFDERLLEHIQQMNPSITTRKADLIQSGMPRQYTEFFDAVILDPPWDHHGLWNFLDKALFALSTSRHARIFLSFNPLYLEYLQGRMSHFWKRLAQRGLIAEKIQPHFHLYSMKNTQFFSLLKGQMPALESPLLDCLKELPYGYSNLYTLRRDQGAKTSPINQFLFRWWHGE